MEAINVRQYGKFLKEFKIRRTEEVGVWKKTSAETADSFINDVKVAKADSVKMAVESNLILACFDEHVRTLQTLVNVIVDQKVTFTDTMKTTEELLESGRSISESDYSVKISKQRREVQRLTRLEESKDLELQAMPGVAGDARLGRESYPFTRKPLKRERG